MATFDPEDLDPDDRDDWLAPLYSGLEDLNIDLPSGPDLLNTRHLHAIREAWTNGVVLDTTGHIWIRSDRLHTVLRTNRASAAYLIGGMQDRFKQTFSIGGERVQCVSGIEVATALDETIQSPGSLTQRAYAQYSSLLYITLRDHPEVTHIIGLNMERVNRLLPTLKNRRIDAYGVTSDELTLEPLRRNSQFSHIRGKRVYPHYALEIWNGLIVNVETHNVITGRGILDENGLLELCVEMGWDDSWAADFGARLPE